MDRPKNSALFNLDQFLVKRRGQYTRIIDPNTNHQYEELVYTGEYNCPICRAPQVAPAADGVEYSCPGCKWSYKTQGKQLAVWNPATVGVKSVAYPPGYNPETVVDAAISDNEKAEFEKKKSTAKWAGGKNEDWGKKIQTTVPKQYKGPKRKSDET